ncbi:MAG: DMT family transporter [Pseudomonadota bacterium]
MARPGIREYLLLLLLALMWGSSFSFIKIGVHAYSPLVVASGRLAIGALVLWVFVALRGNGLPRGRRPLVSAFAVGLLGNAVPFFLISYGETKINAGLAAILMSVVPLTTVALAHFVTNDEKLTTGKVVGIVLGTIGVIVLVGPETLGWLGGDLPYQMAVLVAAICYAIAALIARNLRDQPRAGAAAVILSFASVMTIPFALMLDQPWAMPWDAGGFYAILYLGLFPTGLAMFLILLLIARAGASFVAFNNYLVPAIGVVTGFVILAEIPAPSSIMALIIILAGIAASQMRRKSRPKEAKNTVDIVDKKQK